MSTGERVDVLEKDRENREREYCSVAAIIP